MILCSNNEHREADTDRNYLSLADMAMVTENTIQFQVPFAIPSLGIQEPTTISSNKQNLQLIVQIIVAVCAGFLLWPKLLPPSASRAEMMEAETKDIQGRIAKLEHERDQAKGQKSCAVATGPASSAEPAKPATSGTKDKASAKKEKGIGSLDRQCELALVRPLPLWRTNP